MADAAIPIRDPIAGLNSILDLYSGKQTVTSTAPETTTSTTKSNMTADQMQSQIDMAMAPLNAAAHGAGLSTYSDTNLALGRAQVAGDIAAKNAGNTTTQTSSGRTTTQTTPGALSSSRIGDTLSSLAVTQLGAPILKKLGQNQSLLSLQNSISNTGSNMLDSVIGSFGGGAAPGSMAAIDPTTGTTTDALGDFIATQVGSSAATTSATEAASNSGVLDSLGSAVSSGFDQAKDWISNLFAEGGMVRKGYADGGYADTAQDIQTDSGDGYAEGGTAYIDRPAASSNLVAQSTVNPILQANGDIATGTSGTIGASASDLLLNYIKATSSGSKMQDPNADTASKSVGAIGPQLGAVAPGPTLGQAGLANAGLTALGLAGPLGALASKALSMATDTPTLQAMVSNSMQAIPGQVDPTSGEAVNALDAHLALNDNYGTGGRGQDGNIGVQGDRGPGGSSGEAGAAAAGASPSGPGVATGGPIRGPGTSTSDSIPAKLSDGEYVIDAKTVDALGPDFFQKLQQMFNPEAIASQAAKGRI